MNRGVTRLGKPPVQYGFLALYLKYSFRFQFGTSHCLVLRGDFLSAGMVQCLVYFDDIQIPEM
jgi:hypothetical protein